MQSSGQISYTPAGRAYCNNNAGLGVTANSIFIALAFQDIIRSWRPDLADIYLCWAREQVRHLLYTLVMMAVFHIATLLKITSTARLSSLDSKWFWGCAVCAWCQGKANGGLCCCVTNPGLRSRPGSVKTGLLAAMQSLVQGPQR